MLRRNLACCSASSWRRLRLMLDAQTGNRRINEADATAPQFSKETPIQLTDTIAKGGGQWRRQMATGLTGIFTNRNSNKRLGVFQTSDAEKVFAEIVALSSKNTARRNLARLIPSSQFDWRELGSAGCGRSRLRLQQ